jgi:hypothetical protein
VLAAVAGSAAHGSQWTPVPCPSGKP